MEGRLQYFTKVVFSGTAGLGGTGVEVVVDEAGGLQEGIADYGAEEAESTLAHVAAYGVGDRGGYGYGGQVGNVVDDPLPFREESQDIFFERAEFFDDFDEEPGVFYGAVDLPTVFHNSLELHQALFVGSGHLCHLPEVETAERIAVGLALAEDCDP